MIRNIVFDMGQVLIRWVPEQFTDALAIPEEDRALLNREVFRNVEWVRLDRGTIAPETAVASVCARLPLRLHDHARTLVTDWWRFPLIPMPGMAALVRELKAAGYGIYLLSNANLELRENFSRIPGSECFDGLLVSSEEKCLKPHPEIYRLLLARFSLEPEECFFVDDAPANVEGALTVGISGAVFHGDVGRLRRELRRAGVTVAEA